MPDGVGLAEAGIDDLVVFTTTDADELTVPGIYVINFDSLSVSPQANNIYDFRLINGALTIDMMPIVIQPDSLSLVYGETLPEITFNYQFEGNPSDLTALEAELNTSYSDVLVDGIALADGFTLFSALNLSLIHI